MNFGKVFSVIVCCLFAGCGGGESSNDNVDVAVAVDPILFFCAKDNSCPEIVVRSDPHSSSSGSPSAFRGYGDPSLSFDATTNTLWMVYSWLDILSNPGLPQHINLGVRTHLAKSTDGGDTFEFVESINDTQALPHPDNAQAGWLINEVPTLVQQPDTNWQTLWFQYFSPVPNSPGIQTEHSDFLFANSIASSPDQLGLLSNVNAAGNTTSTSFGSFFNLNQVQDSLGMMPLADCSAFTEPDLFVFQSEIYLISQCIVFAGATRNTNAERLFLLKQDGATYSYIGQLTHATDAQQFGADALTQPDASFAQDGSVILLMTPKVLGADPEHRGCVVVTFDDFSTGTLQRAANGSLTERAIITAQGNGLGPGLCTYDPNSNTGVLLVITTFDMDGIEFSLHRTGVHP